jgi:peroxiredoxin
MTFTVGDTVPPFTLPRAEGGELTLDPGAGAATVVVFTANHCPYALAWHERLEAVGRDYADRGVTLVQVNANDEQRYPADSTAASAERVARGDFAGPYLRDLTQDVARAWGAQKTPDVYVLDKAGRVVYHGAPDADHGDESQNASWLREALDDVLAARPVARPETTPVGCSIKWVGGAPLTIGKPLA